MKRPRYERTCDIKTEVDITNILNEKLHYTVEKLPLKYSLDYAVKQAKQIHFWLEIKGRTRGSKDRVNYDLSLHKWMCGREMAQETGIPFVLAVKFSDKVLWLNVTEEVRRSYEYGGRYDRGDWQDIEPMVMIPMYQFQDTESFVRRFQNE